MELLFLVALVVVCGAAAIYLWMAQARLQTEIAEHRARAEKAEAEAGKQVERAETLRKKLETTRDETSREDRSAKESKARAAEAKEEQKRLQAALKRAEQATEEQAIRMRRAEAKVEELSLVLAERSGKKPAARMEEPQRQEPIRSEAPRAVLAQLAEPIAGAEQGQTQDAGLFQDKGAGETAPQAAVARQPAEPAVPRPEDPRIALRRAELEAEREQRRLEQDKLRLERDALRTQHITAEERQQLDKLRHERERLARMVFERELDNRLLWKKAEDNRRAYVMTMGALDLAEEEVYRLKHGRERPEFTPTRAAAIAPPHGVEAREPNDNAEFADAGEARDHLPEVPEDRHAEPLASEPSTSEPGIDAHVPDIAPQTAAHPHHEAPSPVDAEFGATQPGSVEVAGGVAQPLSPAETTEAPTQGQAGATATAGSGETAPGQDRAPG